MNTTTAPPRSNILLVPGKGPEVEWGDVGR